MSRIEERYRAVLRLLPATYRQAWEEDMVAAFLASVETDDPEATAYALDYGRPSVAETASVVSLALRLRLASTDPASRTFVRGQAIRLATLMASLVYAVMATAGLGISAWVSGRIPWLPAPPAEAALLAPLGMWHAAWNMAGSAWLPAYIALVLGYRRAAQAVGVLAIVPSAVTTAVIQSTGREPLSVTPWAMLILHVALIVGMTAFREGAPAVSRRAWLLAIPIGVVLLPIPLMVVVQTRSAALLMVDWPGLCCGLITASILVHFGRRASSRVSGPLPSALALVMLAAAAFAIRVVTLADCAGHVQRTTLLTIALAEATVVFIAGAALALPTMRAVRRLPADPARI